jgi:hypothetical protein
MSRYKKDPKTNSDTAWAKAVGDLVREVRQRVFKELRQHKINTKRLFLLSAWSLRNLMSSVKHPEFIKGNERVIDELRFMQALMDAVLEKRRRLVRKHRSSTSSSSNLLAHQGSFQNVMVQP